MKRWIAILLTAVLCVASLPLSVFAADSGYLYSDDETEELYYQFEYVSHMVESMFGTDAGLAYWKYVNDMAGKKTESWLIGIANKIIGEEPDKQYYTKILTNMIAMYEYDLAQQIESQGQFDNLKNIKDYGMDLVDVGATVIGLDDQVEDVAKAIKAVAGQLKVAVDTLEEVKLYEMTIRNYAKADNFLRAICEHSDNPLLKEAASDLLGANELLFKTRMEHAASIEKNAGTFAAKTYLADFSFSILKNIDEYKTDSIIKEYVDFGESSYQAIDQLLNKSEAVFKAVMMEGDILFGTTNTFRRHNEMAAMADISEALVAAYSDIRVSKNDPPEVMLGNIRAKCEYYKMLLSTHVRGEYLIYRLTYNNAGVLSHITKWKDNYLSDKDQPIRDWYYGQVDYCETYYAMVDSIFQCLGVEQPVVYEGFELHDGFIKEVKQLDTVPEGYIGIYTFEDFNRIAESCPSDSFISSTEHQETAENTAKYILMNDITFPAEYDNAAAFYGELDGNGYTMYNLSKPLFSRIGSANIRNLGMTVNCTAENNEYYFYYGTVARTVMDWNNDGGVQIDNCFVKGSVDITCESGYVGGFLGGGGAEITNCYNEADMTVRPRNTCKLGGIASRYAEVSNCFNAGELRVESPRLIDFIPSDITAYVGGIQADISNQYIRNCYNTGNISVNPMAACEGYSGGIVGYIMGGYSDTYISDCYNLGNITNEWTGRYDRDGYIKYSHCSGGIAGYSRYDVYFERCWNGGEIVDEYHSGGLIGYLYSDSPETVTNCYNIGFVSATDYAGGIVGEGVLRCGIVNCYNAGSVRGGIYGGAIAGSLSRADTYIKDCYYLDNGLLPTYDGSGSAGAKALTAEQMKDPSSFVGFDFFKTWKLRDDDTMPVLKH